MKITSNLTMSWRHQYTHVLVPTGITFQGIAVPMSGLKRRPRPETFGTDLRPRTP